MTFVFIRVGNKDHTAPMLRRDNANVPVKSWALHVSLLIHEEGANYYGVRYGHRDTHTHTRTQVETMNTRNHEGEKSK